MKEGWEVKKLGDCIRLEYGKGLPEELRDPNGKYPVYGANGEKARSNKFYYDKKSIIVGRKGSAGEVNLTEEKFWPLDVTYFVTFDEKKFDLIFLFYLLYKLELQKLAKGVKPGINREEVYSIEVNFPPLSEQKHIVSILDEAFSTISKAKENAEKNLQNGRDLFESYLEGVMASPGKEWEEKKIGEIVKTTQGVQIEKSLQSNYCSTNFLRYLYISDFYNDSNLKYVENNYPSKIVTEKDLVVVNTGATAGQIFRGIYGVLSNNLFKVSFDNNILDSEFLYFFVSSNIFKNYQKKIVRGTANPHMGHENFNSTTINLPPIGQQRVLVKRLSEISENTKKLESIYQMKLEDLEELKKTILHKAFEGEL